MAHEVVFERFHNSQNENDMNYKNSHSMISLFFVLRRGSGSFAVNKANKFRVFSNNSE